MANVFLFAETRNGTLRPAALEALPAARELAGTDQVHAMVVGPHGISAVADRLAAHGADLTIAVEHDALAKGNPEVSAATAAAAIRDGGYGVALFSASAEGRDLAPRVAAALDRPLAADVTSITAEGAELIVTHPVYTGKAIATMRLTGSPAVLSLRPGAWTPTPSERTVATETRAPAIDPASARVVITEVGARTSTVDLADAPVVIAGGRGLRAAENFAMLEELAAAFGNAAVGATRAVTDDGWRDPATQIGQTGRLVSPGLYFAIGISGAIQHLAGMRTARTIVAINKDKDAPIFKVADYGIVGDLFEVVPALTEAVRTAKTDG
jgi:electron transfer flavoprotein alpha subunit